MAPVIVGVVALIVGVAAGFLIRTNMARSSAHSLEAQAQQRLVQADQRTVQAEQEAAQTLRKALEDAKDDAGPDPPGGRGGREGPAGRDRPPGAADRRHGGRAPEPHREARC